MSASIAKALTELIEKQQNGSKMNGAMIAKVVDNVDPEGRYRVRVSFPWLSDQYSKETTSDGSDSKVQSFWARMTTLMAGKDNGSYWIPEIDDEVLVVFENGDFAHPIITGCLWNGVTTAPKKVKFSPDNTEIEVSNKSQGGKNDFRFMRSRMGHTLAFIDKDGKGGISLRTAKSAELYLNDTNGSECIKLYDSKQTQWLTIDTAKKSITMQTDEGDILIKAKEKIRMECNNLEISAKRNIDIDAGNKIHQSCMKYAAESTISTEMDGGNKMKLVATRIDLNP